MAAFQRAPLLRDNANELFEVLFETVKTQQAQISALQDALRDAVQAPQLAEVVQSLSRRQDVASEAISALQSEVEVKGSQVLPVGAATVANRAALESIAIEVSKRAAEADVSARLQRLEERLENNASEFKEWAVSSLTAAALEQSCVALAQRCDGLEQRLDGCLGKAEAEILVAAAERLRSFDSFVSRTDSAVERLADVLHELARSVDVLTEENTGVRDTLADARRTLDRKADVASVEDLVRRVSQVSAFSKSLAPRTEHDALVQEMAKAQKGILKLKEGLQTTIETMHLQGIAIHKIDDEKASRAELDESVAGLRQSIAVLQSALQRAIRDRCTVKEAEQIREDVKELTSQLTRTDQMAQLGLKFVDWFSNRGQAYEHNLGALDRHLKNLVLTSARPEVQQTLLEEKIFSAMDER